MDGDSPRRFSRIYCWLCGRTGRPVYVGKTSQTLASRLRSQRRAAAKGDHTAKSRWLQAQAETPRMLCLEVTTVEKSSAAERRWVRRLGARFDLLNEAPAGAGNPGVGRVAWTSEIDSLLGTISDARIAEMIGCERKTVSYRRESFGIAPSGDRSRNLPPPANGGWNRIELPLEAISALGTRPDHEIAERFGVGKKRITTERNARGIKSFAATTGQDGRIRHGEPHRRWTPSRGKFAPSPAPRVAS